MKVIKKITSLMLVMFMALATMVSVYAADPTYTITINNEVKGHTYEAYQIFSGSLRTDSDGKKFLGNVAWGSGVTDDVKTALGDAAAKANSLTSVDKANAFAKEVASYLGAVAGTSKESNGSYTIDELEPGYYLIKDKDGTITGNDTYTGYILKVVGNVAVTPKSDKPSVEKKVDDVNDSTNAENEQNWQDSADYDIGDAVPFKLTGTLPSNYADYDTYQYIFHDTLSKGLTYNGDAKVYVVAKGNEEGVDISKYFTISSSVDEETKETKLTISCNDLKVIKEIIDSNKDIIVRYTANLNENANIGSLGNPNEVYLEYSNNPNNGGEGETGNTPEDKVIVFTFKTIFNKVDEKGNALSGAEFTLEKWYGPKGKETAGYWQTINVVKNEAGTTFTFSGLDDGLYRLTETTTPDGYNTIDPIYFKVIATHDLESDDPKLNLLSVVWVDKDGNKIEGELDSGILNPIDGEGNICANIVNKSGIELPETGGIGTTIFYVVGGAMMLGAAVLFITKKRMEE